MHNIPNADIEGRPIVETPGVCGGSPRIYGTRIPVWVLEGARRKGWTDLDLLENYPTINQADLEKAWMFVAKHQQRIEEKIRDNNGPTTHPSGK